MFEGKKRQLHMVLQGRFKQPIPATRLMLGSELHRPLRTSLPGKLVTRLVWWLLRKLGGPAAIDPLADKPYLLASFLAQAQLVNVAVRGQEPAPLEATEDMRLFDASMADLQGRPWPAEKRRAHFREAAARPQQQGGMLDTEHIWTFHAWEHNVCYSTYHLKLPLWSVDLVPLLDGQPMQFMLKDSSSGKYVMNFEVDMHPVLRCAIHKAVHVSVQGLSHCFEKDEANKLTDRYIIEPVSASSLECMANGARTSFKAATGVHFKDAVSRNKAALPPPFNEGIYCDNFVVRCEAAARTWLRPHAQDNLMDLVPLGKVKGNFNFNLDDKRVLNFENLVSDSDNIKQDISIDVYGRAEQAEKEAQEAKAAEEKAAAAAAAAAPVVAEDSDDDDDDLDALLAA